MIVNGGVEFIILFKNDSYGFYIKRMTRKTTQQCTVSTLRKHLI